MASPSRGKRLRTSASKESRLRPNPDRRTTIADPHKTSDRRRWAHVTMNWIGESTRFLTATRVAGREYNILCANLPARSMRVLLLRPVPGNERFGLGPFFRIEPLGMEYIAAALEARGHDVTLVDLRFGRPVEHYLEQRPALVGVAAMHALETENVLDLVARIRRVSSEVPVVVGGHTAAAYPAPFASAAIDAIVLDDGERAVPRLVEALEARRPWSSVAGVAIRGARGAWVRTAPDDEVFILDSVPRPSRQHVDRWRKDYACLAHRPTWLVETARGCPLRCSFCSIWQLHARSVRERSIWSGCDEFEHVGGDVFVADDLFCDQ